MPNCKLFNIVDIFNERRGTRLTDENIIDGEIPYISSTKKNNGIRAFIQPPADMVHYTNCMTLSNSGSVGYLFYHNYEFVASDHVTVLSIKDKNITLNRNIALYLKPIFESMSYKYNFGREISDERIAKEQILLPATSDIIPKPDWDYMNQYIEDISKQVSFNKINTTSTISKQFDISTWKEFSINELFPEINPCKCTNASCLIDGDEIYYLGAKKGNNCVVKKVMRDNELVTEGKCMVFICDGDGSVGYSNYIPFDEFIGTTNLKVGYNEHLNKYIGIFLTTVFDLQRDKYSFGRKYGRRLKKTSVLLPAKEDGTPDYEYMEQYIKSLPYGDNL